MKIGIIGASGQVGSEFSLHHDPKRLILWSHKDLDICNPKAVERVLSQADVNVVINMAAFHNTDACEADPVKAFAVNAIGTSYVAKACAARRIKLVYASTDYVFGLDEERSTPYLESDSTGPVNIYGASKVAGENVIRAICPNHLIVRTSNLFGGAGRQKVWTFPDMVVHRSKAKEPLRIVGDQIVSPTYTPDLVKKTLQLLAHDATGTVHLSNIGQCSWLEYANATLKLIGLEHELVPTRSSDFPHEAKRPRYSAMDSSRLIEYKLEPMRPWQDALEEYLKEKGWLDEHTD